MNLTSRLASHSGKPRRSRAGFIQWLLVHRTLMRERRLLFLDASHLTAYRWRSGVLTLEERFAADDDGWTGFTRYLTKCPGSIFYLLTELADEDFKLDNIPFVRGRDRHALIERKLGQCFYGTPFRLALPLGREQTGRRDEKLLFAALIKPQHVEPWLAPLREHKYEVKGLYSLPLLVGTLVAAHLQSASKASLPTSLLIVTVSSGGLRQTFFDNGTLRFSRLSALPDGDLTRAPAVCAAESATTRQYLIRRRLVMDASPLSTVVLVHPADIVAFREQCQDSADLHFQFLDLSAQSRRWSLKALPRDSRSEFLFLHLMVQKPPALQFAPETLRRHYHLGRVRLTLMSAGALALFTCLLVSGTTLYNYLGLRDETNATRLLAKRDSLRYAATLETLPPLPTSIDNLRAVIARYDELVSHSAMPLTFYQRISDALEEAPEIQLNRIDWRANADPDEDAETSEHQRPPTTAKTTVVADIYGQVPATVATDPRALLATIEAFCDRLRKDGDLDVRTLKLPFDVASSSSLKRNVGNAAASDAFAFTVRLSQK